MIAGARSRWKMLAVLLACGCAMSIVTAWIVALAPAWDREELRRFVAPWADGRRSRSRAAPIMLLDAGRSAGVANQWLWECTWRFGASRVSAVPALDRNSPLGYTPPWWSEPARSQAADRPDALPAPGENVGAQGVAVDMAFGIPFPCMWMHAELPMRDAAFEEWTWSSAFEVVPLRATAAQPRARRNVQGVWSHGLGRIPMAPLWAGLAANSVAWAALLGAVMWARHRVRWMGQVMRRDRGRCADCGYELARVARASCPECGALRQAPLSDRAVAWFAAVTAVVVLAVAAWSIASDVPVNWRGPFALPLLWPTLAMMVACVLLLASVWGLTFARTSRAPQAATAMCVMIAAIACAVWCAELAIEGAHAGRVALAILGAVATLSI
ncbi:MAG: hypothetical protein JNK53_03300, partial [Phycisphaerae bacterium]|nr:hypothetical protein [Phycisphaerae bacterium]